MMSSNWEQKRKLLLSLGTKEYPKPTQLSQLPFCEAVLDSPLNRLTDAENFVKSVASSTFVYSDTCIFVCGFPWPKKGLRLNRLVTKILSVLNFVSFKDPLGNPFQNQESISWIHDRLQCTSYRGSNGQLIFEFKNYLEKYIQSIDPQYQVNDIRKALYCTTDIDDRHAECIGAMIFTKTAEASSKIQRILDDRPVSDIFPGKN